MTLNGVTRACDHPDGCGLFAAYLRRQEFRAMLEAPLSAACPHCGAQKGEETGRAHDGVVFRCQHCWKTFVSPYTTCERCRVASDHPPASVVVVTGVRLLWQEDGRGIITPLEEDEPLYSERVVIVISHESVGAPPPGMQEDMKEEISAS